MSYPKSFSPEQQEILSEFAPALSKLKPGTTATLEHDDPTALAKRRYLLYSWLHIENLKEEFTIKTLSPTSILIIRKSLSRAKLKIQKNEFEEFVLENLIDVVSEEKALEVIRNHFPNADDQLSAYNEWKRITGE